MVVEMTKDQEIRRALMASQYIAKLRIEDKETLVMEEFALITGETRIDLAVLNGSFHGFEIKSDKDTLERLPHQADYYKKVFQYLCLVVGRKYVEKTVSMLPEYWGILIADKKDGITTLLEYRRSSKNMCLDSYAIASMLWREEALSILMKFELIKGIKSKPKKVLWSRLSENLPLEILESEVRSAIKARRDWRVVLKRKQCDVKSQPSSKLSHFLGPLPF